MNPDVALNDFAESLWLPVCLYSKCSGYHG